MTKAALYLVAAICFCIYMALQPDYIDSSYLPEMYGRAEAQCGNGHQASCVDKAQIMMCINGDDAQCPVEPDSVGNGLWVIGTIILVFAVVLLGLGALARYTIKNAKKSDIVPLFALALVALVFWGFSLTSNQQPAATPVEEKTVDSKSGETVDLYSALKALKKD
jgi:hypothetical protein